jgi:hypothetical protein
MPTYEFDLCVYRPSLDQIVEHWRGMYASRNYTYPRFSLNDRVTSETIKSVFVARII